VGYLSRYVEGKMRPQVEEEIQKLLDAASQEALPDIVPTNPRDVEFVAGIKYHYAHRLLLIVHTSIY
jgi:hypothetical protein